MYAQRVATWMLLPALWLSWQADVNPAEPPAYRPQEWAPEPQPLEDSAARLSSSPHPDGCLAPWPAKQTLDGRLVGIVWGGAPDSEAILYLSLDSPIAVCASPENYSPAWEDVTRIKIQNMSVRDFLYVMRTWARYEVQITGTLNTAGNNHQEPGPVLFGNDFELCGRSPSGTSGRNCVGISPWRLPPGKHLEY